jgi:hypothetical protein
MTQSLSYASQWFGQRTRCNRGAAARPAGFQKLCISNRAFSMRWLPNPLALFRSRAPRGVRATKTSQRTWHSKTRS